MIAVRRRAAGFSLVETLIALVLFLLAAAFAAQLLAEAAERLADAAAELAESPAPLVRARLRADVQAAAAATCQRGSAGRLEAIRLAGHPAGRVIYRLDGGALRRTVEDARGRSLGESELLRFVTGWECGAGGGLLRIEIRHERRAPRRTALTVRPEARGRLTEPRVEVVLAAPRGGGLGAGW